MKPATQAVRDTLIQDMAVRAQPRLIAEWEYNRFFAPTVTVTPDQGSASLDWTASYDTNSIGLPFRPTAGIARLRADNGVVPTNPTQRQPSTTRFYPTPDSPRYSYFASVQRSQLAKAAAGDGYEFDAPIKVSMTYPEAIAVNKIVVGFETGYGKPSSYTIQVSPDGKTWQSVYSGTSLAGDGTVTVWHSPVVGSGWGGTGWDTVEAFDSPVLVQGVRINVYAMDTPYTHLDLLQLSPRLENDLTPYLIDYEYEMSQDTPSFISPLGKASSNTATVNLSNIDQRFNNENHDSLYYQMIEKKVRFKMDLGIDASNHGGKKFEYIREFTMWADAWSPTTDNSTIQVQLKDSSVILQEATMPSMFLQNATIGQIIWQTLDTIGMNNYAFTKSDTDYGQVIPYYWPSDNDEAVNQRWLSLSATGSAPATTTIWDEISDLCEATQTALYFDQNDVLQIKARESMFNTGKKPDWNFDAVKNANKMPDVKDTQSTYDLTTNQIELSYKPMAMADDNNGFPKMEVVWQPQAAPETGIVPTTNSSASTPTILVRASALTRDLPVNGNQLWLSQKDAIIWPFESDVNIEGEMMHYVGKEYAYYDAKGNIQYGAVKTADDQSAFDAINDDLSFKNAYTGLFYLTARGLYGTGTGDHYVQGRSYNSIAGSFDNRTFFGLGTGWTNYHDGYITQTTYVNGSTPNGADVVSIRKNPQTVRPKYTTSLNNGLGIGTVWYGAKIRFPGFASGVTSQVGGSWQIGGLYIGGTNGDEGYYVEFTTTTQIDGWEQRATRNEISLFGVPANAPAIQYAGTNANDLTDKYDSNGKQIPVGKRGFQVSLNEDAWYDVDVKFTRNSDRSVSIGVYLNGVLAGTWNIPLSQAPNYVTNWTFGTYVRGPSAGMDIDYLYAFGDDDTNPFDDPDQTTFLDIERGGFASRFVRTNALYSTGALLNKTQPSGHTVYPDPVDNAFLVYDEFGPVVHEVRTFNVAFDTSYIPVVQSYLYITNSGAEVLSYQSDATGASFVIANASRNNVVLQGEDATTFGSDSTVTYTMSIYGRVVYSAQNDSIKVIKDDAAIRRQGLVRTSFDSRYIQTDSMASAIGDWILSLWAMGIDEVQATVFGNPLLQIGDLVTMNYPIKGMAPTTHQYYITNIKSSFNKGYTTELTLRRARTI